MSGKVLIVDDSATARIVLKVKLAAAYYDVTQAGSVDEAAILLSDLRPDIILMGLSAQDTAKASGRIVRLRQASAGAHPAPVVVILSHARAQDRLAILRAGAEDVLSASTDEQILLARMRRLMRRRLADQELRHHALSAQTMGFAEAQNGFALPGRIALVCETPRQGHGLLAHLVPHLQHRLDLVRPADFMGVAQRRKSDAPWPGAPAADGASRRRPEADLFVIDFGGDAPKQALRLLSDLRAGAGTRRCPVIAILPPDRAETAVQCLDMGAADAIFDDASPEEIAFRLDMHLRRKHQRDQMREQLRDGLRAAVIDPLTGLYNRRYAMSYLDCLMKSQTTPTDSFAVMLADLDHFKQVNDTHGHAAGDAVLARVAQLLQETLGKDDLIARIGGEEFLIIIPGTSRREARDIATGLCALVRDTPIALPDRSVHARVTISIGLTLAKPGALLVEDILYQADRALYRSKAEGRNTVRFNRLSAA